MSARRLASALILAVVCVAVLLAISKQAASPGREAETPAVTGVPATIPAPSAVIPTTHSAAPSVGIEAESCERVCQASAPLGCRKAAACKASCEAMAATGVCQPQLGAFFKCLEAQPSGHWECLEDGTAAIRESYCDSEQAGFAACLQEKQI